jgi:predicted regulator of Ras-like GTPase activity (Roadblock/LC7/MglB family)
VLTSLFGDLGSAREPREGGGASADGGFAATTILESVSTEVNTRGQIVDRHSSDLVVSGSPAQAIREHFAATRSDLGTATSLITLLDPAGIWASAVIKALSDAGGRPIERLHLREHATLRTLATIERTTLVRRHEETLRIYHADVRAPGSDNAEIPVALMERSQMTTVIIGPLQPHAIDALLAALRAATLISTWRCPNLLFMLPPNAVWIANKVGAIPWPARLNVHVLSESMTGASSVWNAMLGMWNHLKAQPAWDATGQRTSGVPSEASPDGVAADSAGQGWPPPSPASTAERPNGGGRGAVGAAPAQTALAAMLTLDGLLGCAVVDATTGLVLAQQSSGEQTDMSLAAAACAQVLRAHRQLARSMGLPEPIDELITSAGARQQIVRGVSHRPELFLVALLDKQRTNLALARFQLADVERGLN